MVVAGVAIDQAIPLGRVWSFPSKIVRVPLYDPDGGLPCSYIGLQLEKVRHNLPLLFERDNALMTLMMSEATSVGGQGLRITGITVPQGE